MNVLLLKLVNPMWVLLELLFCGSIKQNKNYLLNCEKYINKYKKEYT